jgi:hypothetical protein
MKRLAQDLMAWKKTYTCFKYPHAKTLQNLFVVISVLFQQRFCQSTNWGVGL